MKVYVTQGHEKGIGLEVFFKSAMLLSKAELNKIKLIAYKYSVESTLKSLRIPYNILKQELLLPGTSISVTWLDHVHHSESFTALELGMKLSESGGVLFTLPTSKDQFPGYPGHTEYFRAFYKRPELGMFFSSPTLQVLLLSDHVAVGDLTRTLTEDLIYARIELALTTLKKWNWPTKRILIAGMNPHAGESGLIGHEDERVTAAIKRLKSKLKLDFIGPLPGDTMLLEKKSDDDLLVYLFHDQGLGVFKGIQGFIGANITLGLPYPRVSPDHGTSFGLYGKNSADYRGTAFALKEALKLLSKVTHGKNSSHQGQSS